MNVVELARIGVVDDVIIDEANDDQEPTEADTSNKR